MLYYLTNAMLAQLADLRTEQASKLVEKLPTCIDVQISVPKVKRSHHLPAKAGRDLRLIPRSHQLSSLSYLHRQPSLESSKQNSFGEATWLLMLGS